MSKRTLFTTVTPLPSAVSRAAVTAFLHDYEAMIDLNPLVKERHRIQAPANADPDEAPRVWYQLTDAIAMPWSSKGSSGRGSVIGGKTASKPDGPGKPDKSKADKASGDKASGGTSVSYTCVFHPLADGLQTHCSAPLGVDIRERWTVGGTLPGEPRQPAELGLAALGVPAVGHYLREDVDLRCNRLMAGFVKKTLKRSHAALVERLCSLAAVAIRESTAESESESATSSSSSRGRLRSASTASSMSAASAASAASTPRSVPSPEHRTTTSIRTTASAPTPTPPAVSCPPPTALPPYTPYMAYRPYAAHGFSTPTYVPYNPYTSAQQAALSGQPLPLSQSPQPAQFSPAAQPLRLFQPQHYPQHPSHRHHSSLDSPLSAVPSPRLGLAYPAVSPHQSFRPTPPPLQLPAHEIPPVQKQQEAPPQKEMEMHRTSSPFLHCRNDANHPLYQLKPHTYAGSGEPGKSRDGKESKDDTHTPDQGMYPTPLRVQKQVQEAQQAQKESQSQQDDEQPQHPDYPVMNPYADGVPDSPTITSSDSWHGARYYQPPVFAELAGNELVPVILDTGFARHNM